jgi:hypothetical protein
MTVSRDVELRSTGRARDAPGRNVIAVVGIDRYRDWRPLGNAVRDATQIAEMFRQLGFDQLTAPLLDGAATGSAIQALVTTDLRTLGANDSLVLFYAGHGGTYAHRPGGDQVEMGYLIPVDAAASETDVPTWIDLEGWLRAVALLPAKHILVILDACHSGIALDGIIERHRSPGALQREELSALQARRSRVIITSALGNQVALDNGPKHGHSLFTGYLLDGLAHGLRRQGDLVTTGSELGIYVQKCVRLHTRSRQTPDFGRFYFDNRGELAISLQPHAGTATHHAVTPPPPPVPRSAATGAHVMPRPSSVPFPCSTAFLSIPDLKTMDGPTSHAAMTGLHRVLRDVFLANGAGAGTRVLSALTGAIVLVPDRAATDVLARLIEAARHVAAAKVAMRGALTRGVLSTITDTDGTDTAVAPSINVAARLACSPDNPGLLIDPSYQRHFAPFLPGHHWLQPPRCERHQIVITGKRAETFAAFAAPLDQIDILTCSAIPGSEDPPFASAVLLAYDLANFSDGDAPQLSARFESSCRACSMSSGRAPSRWCSRPAAMAR